METQSSGAVRDVLVVLFDRFQLLDMAGPVDVLTGASYAAQDGGYRVRTAVLGGGSATAASGTRIAADTDLAAADPPHTLLVVGGWGTWTAADEPRFLAEIRRLAAGAQRTAAVCTGTLILAAAGLADGHRATTHWAFCDQLAEAHPEVRVEPDAIFVRDGTLATSAGVTAGIDLALALVEEDLGVEAARTVGRHLVVFLRRPGGQSQFSAWTRTRRIGPPALRAVLELIDADPAADLSVPALARRAAMSERHFARRFTAETGLPPGRYVEQARVGAARALLESGAAGIDAVARNCGFGTAETMRRAFLRVLGVAPADYRSRFAATSAPIGP
ncbi:GlxA family transcriptional regulator [Nocardiopsis coralliicola]